MRDDKQLTKGKLIKRRPTLKQASHNDINTTIYIKSSTPFVSGIKRINKFLDALEKRRLDPKLQRIVLLGMGKAVEKTLSLACYFEQEKGKRVQILTKSIDVIDEVALENTDEVEIIDERDIETILKKRSVSGIEVRIYP